MSSERYNSLSFRELADRVGIKSSSVHYHFPTKGDLAGALAQRYREEAQATLQAIAGSVADASRCLEAYVEGFRQALERENRMRLCGIFGAEYDHLPDEVRSELAAFVQVNISWLAAVLGELELTAEPAARDQKALAIYAAIVGAQLTARSLNDITVYDNAIEGCVAAGLLPI